MSDLHEALKDVRDRLTGIEEQLRILARIEEKTSSQHEQIVKLFENKDAMHSKIHGLELQIAQMKPQAQSTRDNVKLLLTAGASATVAGVGAFFAAAWRLGGG